MLSKIEQKENKKKQIFSQKKIAFFLEKFFITEQTFFKKKMVTRSQNAKRKHSTNLKNFEQ